MDLGNHLNISTLFPALPSSLSRSESCILHYNERNIFNRLQFHYSMHDAVIPAPCTSTQKREQPPNPGHIVRWTGHINCINDTQWITQITSTSVLSGHCRARYPCRDPASRITINAANLAGCNSTISCMVPSFRTWECLWILAPCTSTQKREQPPNHGHIVQWPGHINSINDTQWITQITSTSAHSRHCPARCPCRDPASRITINAANLAGCNSTISCMVPSFRTWECL